jgi:hypothetical protein
MKDFRADRTSLTVNIHVNACDHNFYSYQEKVEEISALSIEIGAEYSKNVVKRTSTIQAVETFADFVRTFKTKAIQDSVDTMRKQEASRIEFDGFGAKLETLQRTSNRHVFFFDCSLLSHIESLWRYESQTYIRFYFCFHSTTTILGKDMPSTTEATVASASEKELRHASVQFNDAKERYLKLSTAICDKAVLLEMKREVDFKLQLEKLAQVKGHYSESHGQALAGMNGAQDGVTNGMGYPPSQGGVAAYQVPMSD